MPEKKESTSSSQRMTSSTSSTMSSMSALCRVRFELIFCQIYFANPNSKGRGSSGMPFGGSGPVQDPSCSRYRDWGEQGQNDRGKGQRCSNSIRFVGILDSDRSTCSCNTTIAKKQLQCTIHLNLPTFQSSNHSTFQPSNIFQKCLETGETPKSFEYGKCL